MPKISNLQRVSKKHVVEIRKSCATASSQPPVGFDLITVRSGPTVLLPHQRSLVRHVTSDQFISPFLVYWTMGSGKTTGALACMNAVSTKGNKPKEVLILCNLSIIGQWKSAVLKFHTTEETHVTIVNWHGCMQAVTTPERFDLLIADEAHRFRNATEARKPEIAHLRRCPRVLLLTGTPIVNDVDDRFGLFALMSPQRNPAAWGSTSLESLMKNRVSYFNPATDKRCRQHFPLVDDHVALVPMLSAQVLVYLSNKAQDFTLDVDGETIGVSRPVNNRYNAALRAVSNMPFPENLDDCPKLVALVANVSQYVARGAPQVVYSCFLASGCGSIAELLRRRNPSMTVAVIDGKTKAADRTKIARRFNLGNLSVLILSRAAAEGLDLMGTYAFHILEPHQNLSDEAQTLSRAVRYRSHKGKVHKTVKVFRYLCTFPPSIHADALFVASLHKIFDPRQLAGVPSDSIARAVRLMMKKEAYTIDEMQHNLNKTKFRQIQDCVDTIINSSILMTQKRDREDGGCFRHVANGGSQNDSQRHAPSLSTEWSFLC